jgi:hypothetical protein
VPVQVRHALGNYHVSTAQQMGWAGLGNGALLDLSEQAGFDVLVVADKNLRYQQNFTTRRIAIVELWTNHRPSLEKEFPRIAAAVSTATSGAYIVAWSNHLRQIREFPGAVAEALRGDTHTIQHRQI